MQMAAKIEKKKEDELVLKVQELNEAINVLKLAAIKAEKEKLAVLSEKDEKV